VSSGQQSGGRSEGCGSRRGGRGSEASRRIGVSLQPHDFHEEAIPVNAFSDISQPGEYSVRVTWKAPKEFDDAVVKSNTINITVTP
jgi:hypothetical protein